MRCAIVDDEPLALALMESYVNKTPTLELCGKYASAVEAMGGLQREPVDIVFLDIQMPDLNGLDFSKTIDTSRTRIIFTTAFDQYALEGYKVNALDYLLKPISYTDFVASVNRAQKWYDMMQSRQKEQAAEVIETVAPAAVPTSNSSSGSAAAVNSDKCIFVKSDYKLIRIDFKDILYIEGLKDYVKIYLSSAIKPVLSLSSMRSIENALPENVFYRVHRSYIVNMHKVRVFERGQIVFGEKYIPISDSYKERVQNYLNARMLQGRG